MDKVLQTLSGLDLQLSIHAVQPAVGSDDRAQSHLAERREARARQSLREERLVGAHIRIAAMLALDLVDADALERARNQVRKWAGQKLCSQWYVDRWSALLEGSAREIASKMLALGKADASALFQNTPFGFLVREYLRA